MVADVESLVQNLIKREGGFVDHPHDKGGPTKYGITINTLATYRNVPRHSIPTSEVQHLTLKEAIKIYINLYWLKPGYNLIEVNNATLEILFDTGVLYGTVTANKMLQRIVGVKDDGLIGPITRAAIKEVEGESSSYIAVQLIGQRLIHTGNVLSRNPEQVVFANGWLKRMAKLLELPYRN